MNSKNAFSKSTTSSLIETAPPLGRGTGLLARYNGSAAELVRSANGCPSILVRRVGCPSHPLFCYRRGSALVVKFKRFEDSFI